jgi:hypothetical protein
MDAIDLSSWLRLGPSDLSNSTRRLGALAPRTYAPSGD